MPLELVPNALEVSNALLVFVSKLTDAPMLPEASNEVGAVAKDGAGGAGARSTQSCRELGWSVSNRAIVGARGRGKGKDVPLVRAELLRLDGLAALLAVPRPFLALVIDEDLRGRYLRGWDAARHGPPREDVRAAVPALRRRVAALRG